MNTSLDGGLTVTPRRETPSAIGAAPPAAATSGAAAQTGPAAVPPTEAAERGARLATTEEGNRQAEAQDEAKKPATPNRVGSYERRLTYENAQARTFLDVINPENDEVLMRYPPESLVEYLKQVPASSEAATDATGGAVNTRA